MGLLASGMIGVCPVIASSSSESTSRRMGICVIFLGLRGMGFFPFATSVAVALAVARAEDLGAVTGVRTGRARSPVLLPAACVLPASDLVAVGAIFSLSGSWNLTVFFAAADFALDAARPRVGRAASGTAISLRESSTAGCVFFARLARVVFVVTSDCASCTTFLGLPLVGRARA
jgi:hypothetical protein